MIATNAEILCEVNNLYIVWHGMFLQESFALAVSETEEDDVDLIECILACELQIAIAIQSFVYLTYLIACVRFAVGKYNLS